MLPEGPSDTTAARELRTRTRLTPNVPGCGRPNPEYLTKSSIGGRMTQPKPRSCKITVMVTLIQATQLRRSHTLTIGEAIMTPGIDHNDRIDPTRTSRGEPIGVGHVFLSDRSRPKPSWSGFRQPSQSASISSPHVRRSTSDNRCSVSGARMEYE